MHIDLNKIPRPNHLNKNEIENLQITSIVNRYKFRKY